MSEIVLCGDFSDSLYHTNSRSLYKIHDNNVENDLQSISELKNNGYVINLNNYSSEQIYEKLIEEQTSPSFSFN
ncbi:hypothetical protein [uncultured Methanolobus sp.]|uniref:hypothetical protein n=1 Tax=uncultured Methanolobus sp. TaxID=218300 RepID=UPI002AAB7AAB|nr:hypothetical protein [uncultured Methanolobus sp.]